MVYKQHRGWGLNRFFAYGDIISKTTLKKEVLSCLQDAMLNYKHSCSQSDGNSTQLADHTTLNLEAYFMRRRRIK